MNGFDIILIAMIAAFVLLRLRSELGNKTGNEPTGVEPSPHLPGRRMGGGPIEPRERDIDADAVIVDMDEDPKNREGFREIRSADASFNPHQFLEGARSAYPMILEAFWAGDTGVLKKFLDDDVYEQFKGAVDARVNEGHTLNNKFVRLAGAEIEHARLHGAMAEICVRFEAETVLVTRDSDGEVIAGDVTDAVTVVDMWTFARNTRSDDPNWMLVATRAG